MAKKKFSLFSPVESLWDTISGFFEAAFQKVWSAFAGVIAGIGNSFWEWLKKFYKDVGDDTIIIGFREFRDAGWIDEQSYQDLIKVKDKPFPLNLLFGFIGYGTMYLYYIKELLGVITADVGRHLRSKYRSENAQPREMIPAAFIAPEKTQLIRKVLSEAGFPDDQIDLLFISMYKMYDENMIRELYLRGVLTEEKMFERMRENGYTDTRIKEMVQAWPIIPGPTDLFHLVAKEAFEPDMIEHYGYADEFPHEQSKWLEMQGVSDYWAEKYWYAHWETPSIQAGYEMLHRGVIDDQELYDLFRTIEIPPFWRDKLKAIAFMPFTRVDTRRMHKTGTLTTEELMRAYMDVGYNAEKAEKMTDFTVKHNASSGKALTRAQIVKGFTDYILTYEEAKAMLLILKYSVEHADFLLTYADYERTKKYQASIEKTVKKRFMLSLISESQTKDKLNQLNVPDQKVTILIDQWKLDKYDNLKLPSKSDLDAFFTNKIIDEDTYRQEMYRLGYDDKHIGWFIQAKGKERPNA